MSKRVARTRCRYRRAQLALGIPVGDWHPVGRYANDFCAMQGTVDVN